jgi:hypothetical protein
MGLRETGHDFLFICLLMTIVWPFATQFTN